VQKKAGTKTALAQLEAKFTSNNEQLKALVSFVAKADMQMVSTH
jgi:hypothetical protein